MTSTHPNLMYTTVKLSQANYGPHNQHYHGLKHALKYLYATRDNGIYFWRMTPRMELKEGPLPPINSNKQDLLLSQLRPEHNNNILHAYPISDWATCMKT